MNRLRPQKPYVFFPPKYSPWLMPLIHWLAEHVFLRRRFKVLQVRARGVDTVAELVRAGHSVLVAPNHADHADPSILLHIGRRYGLKFHFMAAREGFEQGPIQAFVLQRSGAFSVDREGADLAAIKTAMSILQSGQYPLVIFPEGEIWHHQGRLDVLNEGVATIALRAAARLSPGKTGFLVPAAIQIRHADLVRKTFPDRLNRLERRVAWKPRPEMELLDRIYRLGSGLLALKEEEFLGHAQSGSLVERIQRLQEALVTMVEANHPSKPNPASSGVPERIKTLRGLIRKRLTDPACSVSVAEQTALYDDLDTLFVASQLYSYPGQYLREYPTVDRLAETIFKIEEDLFGQGHYVGPRHAEVHFDAPIEVNAFLQERSLDARSGVRPLTQHLRRRIQTLLQGMTAG